MQEHLANRCPNVPVDVKQVFLEIILRKHQDDNFFDATDSLTTSNSSNSSNILGTRSLSNNIQDRKKRKNNNQKELNNFYDTTNITSQKQKMIDQALTRMFVCCGLPFSLVENPFFIEFVNQLKPAYKLPSRFKLTKDFINEEVANVNVKVEFELKRQNNITLGKENY